jgi:hypothetical protein
VGARFFSLVLGARELGNRGVAVAEKGSWSSETQKKVCSGRQERFLEPVHPKKDVYRSLRKDLGARAPKKGYVPVAKKGSWSPGTPKKVCTSRQERILEPRNPKKGVYRSPRKDLGAQEPKKRCVPVAKKGSWSPCTQKKVCTSRQERILEPTNPKKELFWSPRKVHGDQKQQNLLNIVRMHSMAHLSKIFH